MFLWLNKLPFWITNIACIFSILWCFKTAYKPDRILNTAEQPTAYIFYIKMQILIIFLLYHDYTEETHLSSTAIQLLILAYLIGHKELQILQLL